MKTENSKKRVRPLVVVLLGCLVAGVAIPLWVFRDRPEPAPVPEAAEPAPAPAPARPAMMANKPAALRARPPRRSRFAQKPAVETPAPPAPPPPPGLEDRWGIQVCSLRLSMANSIVDLRYKVTDPEKVALLARAGAPAYLVDAATGAKLRMPAPPKEGAFPPTGNKLTAGKTYFTMVSNQRGALQSGSVVNIMIGDSLATNLVVQ